MQLAGFLVLLILGTMLFDDPGMLGWVFVGVLAVQLASSASYIQAWKRRRAAKSTKNASLPSVASISSGRRSRREYSAPSYSRSSRSWSVSPMRLRDARFALPGDRHPAGRKPV